MMPLYYTGESGQPRASSKLALLSQRCSHQQVKTETHIVTGITFSIMCSLTHIIVIIIIDYKLRNYKRVKLGVNTTSDNVIIRYVIIFPYYYFASKCDKRLL
jgi:ABC-type Fe3+-siderophore transport system permease subunit